MTALMELMLIQILENVYNATKHVFYVLLHQALSAKNVRQVIGLYKPLLHVPKHVQKINIRKFSIQTNLCVLNV